ncbi:unnamed protein product [Lepeophtheirus salmonis]|uniref:(salmon louse) hypothetical protein n=1 Tax=Lepeophtheirus salmonis TaxID=72036 RepID=A0A7R8CSI3_LEPSM|nr:unnamed protein product [Lepeophtheirus salmonis]CAF2917520.1 unnamed protein product [Lepeophtheirus salmonis]
MNVNEGQSKRNKDTFCLTILTVIRIQALFFTALQKTVTESIGFNAVVTIIPCTLRDVYSNGEREHIVFRIPWIISMNYKEMNPSITGSLLFLIFLLLQFPSVYSLIDRYVQLMSKKYRGSCIEYKILKIEESRDVHSKVLIKFDDATNDNPTYSISRINNFLTIWGHRLHLRRVSISHEILNSGKLDSIKLDDLKHTSMGYGRHDMKIEYIEGIFNL